LGLTTSSCKKNFVQKPNNQPRISGTYEKRTKQRIRDNDIVMATWNVLEDVESDLKKMKVKGWKEKMRNREQWRLVAEEAKAHPGL
jgi:hypothetical protein